MFIKLPLVSLIILFFTLNQVILAESGGKKKVHLAVLNLVAKSGMDRATADVFSNFIRTNMVNTRLFTVVEREKIDLILREQAFQQSGCVDTECAVQIGKLLAAEKILTGTMTRISGGIYIALQITDVETGKIDFSEYANSENIDDLENAANKISRKIAAKIMGVDEDAIMMRAKLTWPSMMWRSLLFPGWGHYANGETGIGIFYSLTFISGLLAVQRQERDVRVMQKEIEDSYTRILLFESLVRMIIELRGDPQEIQEYKTYFLPAMYQGQLLLKGKLDKYKKNRRMAIRALGAIYLVQLIHAFVSGRSISVEEQQGYSGHNNLNLSFTVMPEYDTGSNSNSFHYRLHYTWRF